MGCDFRRITLLPNGAPQARPQFRGERLDSRSRPAVDAFWSELLADFCYVLLSSEVQWAHFSALNGTGEKQNGHSFVVGAAAGAGF